MGTINQQNKRLQALYFELEDALAGLNIEYSITPLSHTPVYYYIKVLDYFRFRGDYKECEAFIAGLQTGMDLTAIL